MGDGSGAAAGEVTHFSARAGGRIAQLLGGPGRRRPGRTRWHATPSGDASVRASRLSRSDLRGAANDNAVFALDLTVDPRGEVDRRARGPNGAGNPAH